MSNKAMGNRRYNAAVGAGLVATFFLGGAVGYMCSRDSERYQEGMRAGHNQGVEEGINEGFYEATKGRANKSMIAISNRNEETGDLEYYRFDIALDDKPKNGPWYPDIIVISDLRGIKDNENPMTRQSYQTMVREGLVNAPTFVVMPEESRRRIEEDHDLERYVRSWVHPKYEKVLVDKGKFQTVDPWSYIPKAETPREGRFIPAHIK
jgi:hypothetical protein